MTVTPAVTLREPTFITTAEWASAENSRPPYFFGIIMPKKPLSLMYCHTSGGRSRRTCVMSQSSSRRHSSSTGPSRNACSAGDSCALDTANSFSQRGAPLNSSASHHTVPASSASRSVSDMAGRMRRNSANTGRVSSWRRSRGTLSSSASTPKTDHKTI